MLPLARPFRSPAPIWNHARDLKIDFRLIIQIAHQQQTHKTAPNGYTIYSGTLLFYPSGYIFICRGPYF